MLKKVVLAAAVCAVAAGSVLAGGLPKFGADLAKKANPIPNAPELRIPYTDLISYWGYVKPGSAPDEVVGGKNMYFLYVWIPAIAPEIGIRMASPGVVWGKPAKDDFVSPDFTANSKDKDNYFDTWINFERAADIINPEDIKAKVAATSWILYDANDDSGEMPANPSGAKYNSLLRITSLPSDPMKALVRGLYRIGFTTYKVGDVKGSFLAQVGAPIKIPGIVVAKDIESLTAEIAKNAAKK
jgi:hypothetical protein